MLKFTTFRVYLVTILKTLYPIFVELLYSKYVLYSRPLEGLKIRGHDLPPLAGSGLFDSTTSGGGITPFAQTVPTALILQKVMCHEKATLEAALNLLVFID